MNKKIIVIWYLVMIIIGEIIITYPLMYLFDIDQEFKNDLENKRISDDLREAFNIGGCQLSKDAKILEAGDTKWTIRDAEEEYVIKESGNRLEIYHTLRWGGIIIHSLLLLFLIVYSSWEKDRDFSKLLMVLMLAPLIRLIDTAMPIVLIESTYKFLVIYTPVIMASFLMIKSQKMGKQEVGLVPGNICLQIMIATAGFIFGFVEYHILTPQPIIPSLTPLALFVPMLTIFIFTGFSEELAFRGMILTNAEKTIGRYRGLIFASVLFAIMHIGWKSPADILFVFVVGLFYGFVFLKTRCLLGITISHGITNIMLFMVMPLVSL
ncbi:MAG: hypothetical protein A7316_05985 [Candidatus Altiarchaeales archaeon WOR_SM1_86-2]|nr:MAG: hypothetical protein A7316_05985 [Candidatus Altiarchaeales archaeon WOR_SM1_86-2]